MAKDAVEQGGSEALTVTLPENVYHFEGIAVYLLEPAKVKAVNPAFNDKLRVLVGDKGRKVTVSESSVVTEGVKSEINEIRGQQRQLAETNALILTKLEQLLKQPGVVADAPAAESGKKKKESAYPAVAGV